MTIEEFLEAIRKRGDSRLEKGLTSEEEAMWKARKGRPLPRKHLQLLRGANGIHIDADEDTPQGMFEIHGIEGILESMEVLEYGELPSSWIVVGCDADSQTYAILDAATGKYFTVDAIAPTEPRIESSGCGVCPRWRRSRCSGATRAT
jgi:hypothetical protein